MAKSVIQRPCDAGISSFLRPTDRRQVSCYN